jgi:uncharacterized protein
MTTKTTLTMLRQPPADLLSALACVLILISLSSLSQAEPSEADWKAFNNATVNHFIIPAYQSLSSSAQALNKSTQTLCQLPTTDALKYSQEQFHLTMDDWQSIQNIAFGPIEFSMRSHSLQFWPDKKNHIGKQLGVLLHSNNPELLRDNAFQKASISVKGLPAIERLLFSKTALEDLKENDFQCQVLTTISQNVQNISIALHNEWQEHMRSQFADAKQLDGYFEDDIDAATAILKTIIEPLEVIRDLKLKRPLGSAFGKEKAKRLESWRSERSLRNIKLNIHSLQQMFIGLEALLPAKSFTKISQHYEQLNKTVQQINAPLETAVSTAEGYQATLSLYTQIGVLHKDLEMAISALGIHLGFNSRDGD